MFCEQSQTLRSGGFLQVQKVQIIPNLVEHIHLLLILLNDLFLPPSQSNAHCSVVVALFHLPLISS
jgi:hypothetical protein